MHKTIYKKKEITYFLKYNIVEFIDIYFAS